MSPLRRDSVTFALVALAAAPLSRYGRDRTMELLQNFVV